VLKAEWEKSLNAKFSQQEIKYLNDLFSSPLLKRYSQFQKDFSNPLTLGKLINERFTVKEATAKANFLKRLRVTTKIT